MALYWKGIFNDAVAKGGGTLKVQVFLSFLFLLSFFLSRQREDSRIYLTLFIYFCFLFLMDQPLSCLFLSSFIILRVTFKHESK